MFSLSGPSSPRNSNLTALAVAASNNPVQQSSEVSIASVDLRIDELSHKVFLLENGLAIVRKELEELKSLRSAAISTEAVILTTEAAIVSENSQEENSPQSCLFVRCIVSATREVIRQEDSSDQMPLMVKANQSLTIPKKPEEIDTAHLNTVLIDGGHHFELRLKVKGRTLHFKSISLDKIRQLFNQLIQPKPEHLRTYRILSIRQPRVAYITGAVKDNLEDPWTNRLSKVLREQYSIELKKEPNEGAVDRPYVLLFVYRYRYSPDNKEKISLSRTINDRSGGNGVWLVLRNQWSPNENLTSRQLDQSGLFMDLPQRIPRVLQFTETSESEELKNKINSLADQMCDLVDKVRDEGLLTSTSYSTDGIIPNQNCDSIDTSRKRLFANREFKLVTVSPALHFQEFGERSDNNHLLKIWIHSSLGGPIERKIDSQDITHKNLKTVLSKDNLHYELVLKLKEEKLRLLSESAEIIRQIFNFAKKPEQLLSCQLLPLQKSRVAYITGVVPPDISENSLFSGLIRVLRNDYAIDLRYAPEKGSFPFVYLYAYVRSPSRCPQSADVKSWSQYGMNLSRGNFVWLDIWPWEYANAIVSMTSVFNFDFSGIFMNDSQKAEKKILVYETVCVSRTEKEINVINQKLKDLAKKIEEEKENAQKEILLSEKAAVEKERDEKFKQMNLAILKPVKELASQIADLVEKVNGNGL